MISYNYVFPHVVYLLVAILHERKTMPRAAIDSSTRSHGSMSAEILLRIPPSIGMKHKFIDEGKLGTQVGFDVFDTADLYTAS